MAFRKRVTSSNPLIERALKFDVRDVLPTQGDVLFALQRQKSRILNRTQRGVDVDGRPFAPYNTTRPYYYYPNGPVGHHREALRLKRDRANVKRFATKLGRTKSAVTRSGLGIRFPSYAAFKLEYLGRTNVDLTGPRAPHMLQGILTSAGGSTFFADQQVSLSAFPNTALAGSIGIYGEPGKRAAGHNQGTSRGLPQRHFFGASAQDNAAFAADIKARIKERLRVKYGIEDSGAVNA